MAETFILCSIEGCNGNSHKSAYGCRGMCSTHYQRALLHGDPHRKFARELNEEKTCGVGNCNANQKGGGQGYCRKHYRRLLRHGTPTGGRTYRNEVPAWIDQHIDHQGSDCLTWPFGHDSIGYGVCDKKLGSGLAHRVICMRAHGPPPTPEHEAAHLCGNGDLGCVNPNHLGWRTHAENMAMTLDHGTHNRGERNGQAIVTEEIVRKVRRLALKMSTKAVAEMCGIREAHVSAITTRLIWGWLE